MKICSPICMVTGLQESNCWGLERLEYLDVSISMLCVHLAFLAWRLQDSWNSYNDGSLLQSEFVKRDTDTDREAESVHLF